MTEARYAEQLEGLLVPIESLTIDPANARTHDDRNIDAIANSLKRFGQMKPIVVREESMLVVAGNGTVVAAKRLGWANIAATVKSMSEIDATAYAIADNRTAELAEWDDGVLAKLLNELDEEMRDAAGFTADDFDDLLKRVNSGAELAEEEEIDEPAREPITKPGDLIVLGRHRVLCGDATVEDDIAQVMAPAERVALTLTDPPYGVGLEYGEFEDSVDNLAKLVNGFFPLIESRSDVVALTPGCHRLYLYPPPTWVLCWAYESGSAYSVWGFNCWQPVMVWGKDPYLATSQGARPDTIVNPPGVIGEEAFGHPCPKPPAVIRWIMERCSLGGDVLDPFLGSGTTLIVADQIGRTCYGVEKDPRYVDIIVRRWENLTGEKATRPTR